MYDALVHTRRRGIRLRDQVIQEEFIEVSDVNINEPIFFRDGRKYEGKRKRRYMLQHAGSNVSGKVMWNFLMWITPDLGKLRTYQQTKNFSRRLLGLTRRVIREWPEVLVDLQGKCICALLCRI